MLAGERTRRIVEQARALGFDLCGVAPAEKFPELENLPEWLARGYAGEMRYLHNPKRQSPELALPGARSVIVCAMNYNTALPYSTEARAQFAASGDDARGWISRYAWGDDYHDVLGARLEKLVEWMRAEFAEPHKSLWYVDTGPIVERVAAKWAGLGWLGKNTCLIHEEMGSWLFLGVVITSLEMEPSLRLSEGGQGWRASANNAEPAATKLLEEKGKEKREKGLAQADAARPASGVPAGASHTSHESQVTSHAPESISSASPLTPPPDLCGQCTLCIDACPTGAIVEPYVLDARRCISYLTIELRGPIPEEFHDKLGWHIFGCDICQDVCPYNRRAPVTERAEFQPRTLAPAEEKGKEKWEKGLGGGVASEQVAATLFAPHVQPLAALSEEQFAEAFANSAIRRTKHAGLARNIAAISQDP